MVRSSANDSASHHESASVCVVGLGYVGLPLAVEFWRAGHVVTGFDVNPDKVETLRSGTDPTGDIGDDAIRECGVQFTDDETVIRRAEYVLVAVPTPVDDFKTPDLEFVRSAGEMIGRNMSPGTTAVLESTVYPGATREVFVPALEEASGLSAGSDFFVGYSPERIVPGDDDHKLPDVVKIVSGQNEEVLEDVASLYGTVVSAGIHRAPEIEVAEAAKALENIQRDVNIALVNQIAVASEYLDIDTQAVLEAAGTKWNFHRYEPGLVGGHCIPVDPFFMIYELKRKDFTPQLIQEARNVNDYLPRHVGNLVLRGLNECGNVLKESSILVLGLAYKPGVGDVRTSAVGATIDKLESYGVDVVGVDPYADEAEVRDQFGIEFQTEVNADGFDGILLATPHDEFVSFDYVDAADRMAKNPLLVDIKGVLDSSRLTDAGYEYVKL